VITRPPSADGCPAELASVIARAGALVNAEGWVPAAVACCPGTTLSLALCRASGCEIFRPGYPIQHTDVCRLAHARVVGWLYLEGLAGDAEVRLPEALGEWERWSRPGAALVAHVATATAGHVALAAALTDSKDGQ
jgi:hypothetical protein